VPGGLLAQGGLPAEIIGLANQVERCRISSAGRKVPRRVTHATQTALMDWLLGLLLSKEAAAFSIALVAASIFVVAWRLWGRD
jgi:hypothetical protein